MPPEISALAAKPHLLLAVLSVGALFGIAIEVFSSRPRRRAWRRRNHWRQTRAPEDKVVAAKPLDAADQLRIVMKADFSVRPLLNKSEARLFKELDRMVIALDARWQVMAQVSLGEVLRCDDGEAYRCINSKRVDLLLMDAECMPRHAIEYQGKAHYRSTAAARDAVKKEALRRAGIGYHEVVAGQMTPSELRRLVEKLVVDRSPTGA